jgi:uncharacterized membrane protein YedE/YeeE
VTAYFPWWLGALALAVVAIGYFLIAGRLLGVSGSFEALLRGPDPGALPGEIPFSAHVLLLVGVTAGGALAALLRGELAARLSLGAEFERFFGSGALAWAALFAGGVCVGFGTAMAGGCTSGHGLCGTSRLQPGSLVTTASFFGTAVVTSFLISAVLS